MSNYISTTLPSTTTNILKHLLKQYGFYYEPSECYDKIHLEIKCENDEQIALATALESRATVLVEYFREHLPQYKPISMTLKSKHPDDYYLYVVMAYNMETNMYAVWTCWNTLTESLNHGHYCLSECAAYDTIKEFTERNDSSCK